MQTKQVVLFVIPKVSMYVGLLGSGDWTLDVVMIMISDESARDCTGSCLAAKSRKSQTVNDVTNACRVLPMVIEDLGSSVADPHAVIFLALLSIEFDTWDTVCLLFGYQIKHRVSPPCLQRVRCRKHFVPRLLRVFHLTDGDASRARFGEQLA